MAKQKADKGRVIYYDHVPDEIFTLILNEQIRLKEQKKRNQVSLGAAITSLIRKAVK